MDDRRRSSGQGRHFRRLRLTPEKNPLKLLRLMNPAMKGLLVTDILVRFCEQIPYAFVVVWCMKTITQPVSAVQFGLLDHHRDDHGGARLHSRGLSGRPQHQEAFCADDLCLFHPVSPGAAVQPQLRVADPGLHVLRGLKEFGEPTRKALIMDLSPDHCKAGMFGLYYLIRDVFVSLAALGGAFLWQISPQTNLVTAFVCGIIGTVGFAAFGRDMPVPSETKGKHQEMNEKLDLNCPFREALKFWTKLGFISFGGPAGQIAIMHQEVVERRKWIGENQFLRALNFLHAAARTRGPATGHLHRLAAARHVGRHRRRFPVRDSVHLRDAAAQLPGRGPHRHPGGGGRFLRHPAGGGGRGDRGGAAHRQKGAQTQDLLYGFAALAFVAIFFFKVPFPYIVAAAALGGLLMQRPMPRGFLQRPV
jgi:hypothetical protein